MSLLTLDSIAAATPEGRPLFSGLTLAIGRERVGLVGRNGSGKSTLLAIIAGSVEPAAGSVARAARIGLLRQIQPTERTIAEALGIADGLARLDRLDRGEGSLDDAGEADWDLPDRLAGVLDDVGLGGIALDRATGSLSGGERTRIGLARLLLDAPDLLLLDEPTNNLDAEGRAAVITLLARWKGGALVASHDRDLLEGVDRIAHLSPIGVTLFGGGWSAFAAARDAERERAGLALERADQDLHRQKRAVQQQVERKARRDAYGRMVRARGGAPKILLDAQQQRAERSGAREGHVGDRLLDHAAEALDQARARVEILTPLTIDLPPTGLASNRTLLAFEAVELTLGDRRLFGPLSFSITGPERVAVIGPNGSGKTSLLELATARRAPTAGRVRRAEGAIAMLDQHVALLDPTRDLVANLRRHHPELDDNGAHAALARFAFRNKDARRLAATLSGGEQLRAGLAVALSGARPPQLLILDEPTNHLDIDAIETLESALAGFDGALLVVSHDRHFLEAIGIERQIMLG